MHLSPSEYHRYLTEKTSQSLSYTGGNVALWQQELRAKFLELIGDLPEERCDLAVQSIWKKEHPLGSIEKIVFTAEPFADVPAYVCLPKNAQPPYVFMICLQGHSSGMHNSIAIDLETESENIDVPGDRDFALGCMKRGIAAICIEQRSFGERSELKQEYIARHNKCHDAAMQALLLGKTLVGERIFDVDRAIDYLDTRDDVASIGIMGNSAGGTISVYASALLPRIQFAMPSCCFSVLSKSWLARYLCSCGFIPNLYKYADMPDVLGLFAPKLVVIVSGVEDNLIPITGARQGFAKLKAIYEAAEAAENCHLVEGAEGHRFYANDAWPVLLKLLKQNNLYARN